MHSNQTPSISVSKVGSDKSIPMMETLKSSPAPFDTQYDSGCQFSLISKSALQLLPANTYSLGNSNKINILDFDGQGQLFNATEVRLNLFNHMLKLVVVDTNLNGVSGYSFPTRTSGGRAQGLMLHLTQAKFLFFWEVTTISVFLKRSKEISGELVYTEV